MRTINIFASFLIGLPTLAQAEVELGLYGGLQGARPSDVTFAGDRVVPDADYTIAWEGKSLDTPLYYGLRATYWKSGTIGYGLDFTHAKVYPKDGELPAGFDLLELSDGLNILTANVYRRWPGGFHNGQVTPYVGAGLGVSVPYVEVEYDDSVTGGYQYTGPAAALIAGVSYDLTDRWGLFAEYKATYSQNTGDLETGGTVKTDIVTNAINFGVSYTF